MSDTNEPMAYPDREVITLRDYFAAKALQGLLADSNVQAGENEFAQRAYALADAMIIARQS